MKELRIQNNIFLTIFLILVTLILIYLSSFRNNCLYSCSIYQTLNFYYVFILIYIFPGYCLSLLFSDSLKNNLIIYLLGSIIILPVMLTFYGLFFELSLFSISLFYSIFYLSCILAEKKIKNKLSLKNVHREENNKNLLIYYSIFILFIIMVMLPRLNLLTEHKSTIGDDLANFAKVTSIASSGIPPAFYNFPTTQFVYYFYGYIQAGLITRLTDNFINISQAWFLHVLIQTIVFIWLIVQIARIAFKTNFGILLAISLMTVLGGHEYIVYKFFKTFDPSAFGGRLPDHLEWWTEWLSIFKPIHLQISSFYTLFLWVPQHLMAGMLIIVLFFIIFKTEGNNWLRSILIGLLLSSAFGYSIFAALGIHVSYIVWNLSDIITRKRISDIFIISICVFLLFSSYLIYLFSSKTSTLSIQIISGKLLIGSGLENFTLVPKILIQVIDFLLTIPPYLFIELGIVQFVGIVFTVIWRKRILVTDESKFWFITFFSTFPLIFIVSSINLNDFGMRFIIPAQISLAILTAIIFENSFHILKKNNKIYILLLLVILISLTNPMFEFKVRTKSSPMIDPTMIKIDSNTPISSIIFTNITEISSDDSIPFYGHRLTFKPINQFSGVDKQYTSESFSGNKNNFSNITEICNYLKFSNSKENNNMLKRPLYFINSTGLQKFSCQI